tara:strand:- start:245 stop:502 length:258 start_codon:yes stop_codon:yes gene_type:complete
MHNRPQTTAHLTVEHQCFSTKCMGGKISAGEFEWHFIWSFGQGELMVEPPLGRALIKDALERFLVHADYSLETGGDYTFTIRAKF